MRRRYCYVCRQTFEDNNARDEYLEATCREAGYGQDDEQRDCANNFWVRLVNRWRGYSVQENKPR